ncbi:MAG TPA: hypothetical protein VGS21_09505, partial [Acidimicrobiales bacterium]|nr:hypothetical protein [Acidimicrobiales bacterium]
PVLETLERVGTLETLVAAQAATARVFVADPIAGYAVAIVRATRDAEGVRLGASPRAAIALVSAARAYAIMCGRDFVTPGDVQAVAASCLGHRLVTDADPAHALQRGIAVVDRVVGDLPAPRP